MTSVIDTIIAIIAEKALIDASRLRSESKLEDLGLDSLALVETIFAIEERFDIQVPFDANNPDASEFDLTSIASIATAVESLVAQRAA
ncbi:acyl carrier protein [Thioclava sp. FR2]|uniref:acyl carrier protein n=1 Tax=Thioclava sp. FR2 TaxID=3445780 RepID=UPI003EBFC4A3